MRPVDPLASIAHDSHMATATVRDLRDRFARVRCLMGQEGEVIVTYRGRPVAVLRPHTVAPPSSGAPIDHYTRLTRRMPRALTPAQRRALDQAARAER
jgi:antitoxin (DNA-binding transcriptional repressor) of toxin-antitoxin stability system